MTKPSGSWTYSASSRCTSANGLLATALIFLFALADLAHDLGNGDVHVQVDRLVVHVVHGLHGFSELAVEKLVELVIACGANEQVQGEVFVRLDFCDVDVITPTWLPDSCEYASREVLVAVGDRFRLSLLRPHLGAVAALAVGWVLA